METKEHKNPSGSVVTVSLGDGVSLGNRVSLGYGVSLGNRVSLGDGVSLGYGVSLGDGVSLGECLLSAFNRYGWALYRPTEGPLQLAYGCEDHPLEAWTDEHANALLAQHDRNAKKELFRVLRACRALASD